VLEMKYSRRSWRHAFVDENNAWPCSNLTFFKSYSVKYADKRCIFNKPTLGSVGKSGKSQFLECLLLNEYYCESDAYKLVIY
jgi:hypothetical protein